MVRVLLNLAGSMPNAPGAVGLILAFAAVVALVGITVFNCADGMDNKPSGRGGAAAAGTFVGGGGGCGGGGGGGCGGGGGGCGCGC